MTWEKLQTLPMRMFLMNLTRYGVSIVTHSDMLAYWEVRPQMCIIS